MERNSPTTLPVPAPLVAKQYHAAPPRPMLARDADSMYWMSRYVERAEHVARLLLVNSTLLVDVGDLTPGLQERQWQSVLDVMHVPPLVPHNDLPPSNRIPRHMALDAGNHNSLLSLVTRARDNARGIREHISAEMWEHLNTLYWFLQSDEAVAQYEESGADLYRRVMNASMLFQGLTDQTLARDQRWLFAQLAKYLERVDVTARVIETKFAILRTAEATLEAPLRNIHWMAVLRSCCSLEHYRRTHLGDLDPLKVAAFLLLERNFPRSIRSSVDAAHCAMRGIRQEVSPNQIDAAERILGRLDAQLEYAEMNEVLVEGLPAYLQRIQHAANDTAIAVQKGYFLH